VQTLKINYEPPMTLHLVREAGVFRDDPVVVVDVGAKGGFQSEWKVFGDQLRAFCFEPDEAEWRRLVATAPSGVQYLPFALGREAGSATFYENKVAASSGIYKTNMDYFSRLLNRDNGVVVRERRVNLVSLAEALQQAGVAAVDFIKLDVEGAELDILMGGEAYLRDARLLGVLSEVRFQEEINGSPVFSRLDLFLREYGLRLFDLQFYHQSRHVLPYPGIQDYRTEAGERFFAYTTRGQIMDGDALYFRDFLLPANKAHADCATPGQLLKAAAFFEIYGLNDCAAELIVANRERLSKLLDCEVLLDLLTPQVRGARFPYREYLDRYFDRRGGVFTGSPAAPAGAEAAIPHGGEAALTEELRRVYASSSWRLTGPLRRMASLLRRAMARSALLRGVARPARALRGLLMRPR
jgi:FkbM family methyltransferase